MPSFNPYASVANVAPLVLTIPASQWSGSSGDYYITVSASRVTENSILVPNYDSDSAAYLKGPVWCVPDDGTFTIHTSDVPTDAVTIMVQFPGTMGEAQYQVLADVYSTSQTYSKAEADAAIAQSTASTKNGTVTMATGTSNISVRQYGNVVYIGGWVSNATLTANETTKIADITGISYPPDAVRTFCNVGANAYSVGTLSYISVTTSGELGIVSSNGGTGKAIYFDICYVANN